MGMFQRIHFMSAQYIDFDLCLFDNNLKLENSHVINFIKNISLKGNIFPL